MRTSRIIAVGLVAVAVMAACTSTQDSATTVTVAPTSTTPETTIADTAAPDTSAPATSAAGSPTTSAATGTACPGASGIPSGADIGATITGDVDGDLQPDTITEYSLGGVPHVHSTLATGGQSDSEVQIGFGTHVAISFEDFDYALGAAKKPPVAVLAIGATKAGTAQYTFLTNNIHYCIQPWHTADGKMWVGRISSEGPYEGLSCDTAAGHRYYAVNEAVQAGANWNVTQTVFHHNFTTIEFDEPLPVQVVPDDPTVQHLYGDFSNCDHPLLFP